MEGFPKTTSSPICSTISLTGPSVKLALFLRSKVRLCVPLKYSMYSAVLFGSSAFKITF